MKIGIDISAVVYGTGVSEYTGRLVENLLKIDQENEYVLFGGSLRRMDELKKVTQHMSGRFIEKFIPFPPTAADLCFNVLRFPQIETLTGPLDVFHSSDWTQPKTKAFNVTTVHDLAPIRFQKETHPQIVAVHRRRLQLVKNEVNRIIVPSQATLEDLVNFGVQEERIRVIPEAPTVIDQLPSQEIIGQTKKKYKIDGNYVVTVGVGQRKNTERLIKAFELARAGQDLKLVLIGRSVNRFSEERGLRFTGHVSDEEFAALVVGSEGLIYPSLYEGFGLPILEAFKAQVPVVTSNLSSMPEVAGDAAILVDPYEVDAIADGIRKVLKNRKGLVDRGNRQLSRFSWLKTAEMTKNVYAESRN